jgi:hypothetical protein
VFRLRKILGSGSGSSQYLAQKQNFFPESLPLIFDFLTFVSILCWIRKTVLECIPVPLRSKVEVPAVLVSQHCGVAQLVARRSRVQISAWHPSGSPLPERTEMRKLERNSTNVMNECVVY